MKTDRELATMLGEFAHRADDAEHIATVHEFGITHGGEMAHLTLRECERLCEMAGLDPSLGSELHDAIRKSPGTVQAD